MKLSRVKSWRRAKEPTAVDVGRAYQDHRRALFNYFCRCGAPPPAAEELTQNVFLTLLENPGRFDPERGRLQVFIFGVARNVRRNWERERRQHETSVEPALLEAIPSPVRAEMSGVREAVQMLPGDQREALILREFHGYTYEEIARIQSVPTGTVRSRLARARDGMRRGLRRPDGARKE